MIQQIANIFLIVAFVLAGFTGLVRLELSRAKRIEAELTLDSNVTGDTN